MATNQTPAFATADLCDVHIKSPTPLSLLTSNYLNSYGGKSTFSGKIHIVKIYESNPLVRKVLSSPGNGRVLVVDGGGSKRCALLGDQIALLAVKNNWCGVIINGCIRDSEEISRMDLGVLAIGTIPVKSLKKKLGVEGVTVAFGGVEFTEGDYVFCDRDGVIVSRENLMEPTAKL